MDEPRTIARVGVLLSGRGSNFIALHEAMERGDVPAAIVAVLSDNPEARGVRKARELGIPTAVFPPDDHTSRQEHERSLVRALEERDVDWVCLAGYMRLLTPVFVDAFRHRILNIHPSLLPAFPGLHAQRQAIEHGVKVSGCTVHLVDEELDAGPIVVQRPVPVEEGDDVDSLAARILEQEHRAYPEALRKLLTEDWELDGRRVVFR